MMRLLLLLSALATVVLAWLWLRRPPKAKNGKAKSGNGFFVLLTVAAAVFATLLYLLISGDPPNLPYSSPSFSGGEIVPAEVAAP